jgi:hypothetical protein
VQASNLTTAQLSNVPGPATQVSLGGQKILDLTFSLFTPVGMYFGVLSYNGVVTASVNLDSSLVRVEAPSRCRCLTCMSGGGEGRGPR